MYGIILLIFSGVSFAFAIVNIIVNDALYAVLDTILGLVFLGIALYILNLQKPF